MKIDKEVFFSKISNFETIPFIQSKGWCDSLDLPNVVFYIDSTSEPSIGFWGITTQHKILGQKLIIEAICHKDNVPQKQITSFFKEIIDSNEYDSIYLSDIDEVNASTQIALRRSGFKRPLAATLCPLSILVHTNTDFKFHRNWRRQVTKSVNSGNVFEVYHNPDKSILNTFIALFNELRDRKSLNFGLTEQGLRLLLASPDFFLSLVRKADGTPLCGRITYIRNNHAYDVFAANSDESLSVGAVYQNQQNLFEYLKQIGCIDFDFGRIPPGRDAMDNIYIAKSYSGGQPIVYNGEWEYAKSNLRNWLYAFYRFCIHKSKRY